MEAAGKLSLVFVISLCRNWGTHVICELPLPEPLPSNRVYDLISHLRGVDEKHTIEINSYLVNTL